MSVIIEAGESATEYAKAMQTYATLPKTTTTPTTTTTNPNLIVDNEGATYVPPEPQKYYIPIGLAGLKIEVSEEEYYKYVKAQPVPDISNTIDESTVGFVSVDPDNPVFPDAKVIKVSDEEYDQGFYQISPTGPYRPADLQVTTTGEGMTVVTATTPPIETGAAKIEQDLFHAGQKLEDLTLNTETGLWEWKGLSKWGYAIVIAGVVGVILLIAVLR